MGDRRYTKSLLAGLEFPVARIKAMLHAMKYADRVSDLSAVCLASILQYITVEVLEGAINATRSDGSRRVQPKHINMAVKNDPDGNVNFKNCIIPNAAVVGLDHSAALLAHHVNAESRNRRRHPRKVYRSKTKKPLKKQVRNASNTSADDNNYHLIW